MLFNSFVFLFAFLPITYLVFWVLRSTRSRYVWLTATGYVFYGYWDARFCLLMAFSTLVSYLSGLGFLRWGNDPRRKRWCLVVPITVDLLLLGYFKYAGFLASSVGDLVRLLGGELQVPALSIVLPVGISFYTFHTITYIVDAYRGTIKPTKDFFEFSAYVSLFSQLVAGPIVRFRQIEEDLEGLGQASRSRWLMKGISFFLVGLFEKVVIADSMAAFVDPSFTNAATLSTLGTWLVMLGYTFQIYFDFSGYSTMAIGLGLLFGIRIPINFNSPYRATDPSDFWRRWHISLSSVLRDYLYIPLGGNRAGEAKAYRNLILTMLLGGLWHGANWTFVAWGAYHGLLLALYRRFAPRWNQLPHFLRVVFMFGATVVGWVFFRSPDFATAGSLLATMFIPTPGAGPASPLLVVIGLAIAGFLATAAPNANELHHEFVWRRRYAIPLAAVAGVCAAIMLGGGPSPFLYFQF